MILILTLIGPLPMYLQFFSFAGIVIAALMWFHREEPILKPNNNSEDRKEEEEDADEARMIGRRSRRNDQSGRS